MPRTGSLVLGPAVLAACVSVQDFGAAPTAEPTPTPETPAPPLGGDAAAPPATPRQWAWLNPTPTGRALVGIAGTSERDVWVAGDEGTVAHFDGAAWDVRRTGPTDARHFAVGTRAPGDVWVAGERAGQVEVVHYDGAEWTTSYPFSGASFGGFSRGPGGRLFAFMTGASDWSVVELSTAGTWTRTDTSENVAFGPLVDAWSAPSASWALTRDVRLFRLAAGATRWELLPPVDGLPLGGRAIGLAGAGARLCAFYTLGTTTGYLWYDGVWHVGPSRELVLPPLSARFGARVACLSDGSGVLAHDGYVVAASPTEAPSMPALLQGDPLFGAWSADGARAYAVGAFGSFVSLAADASPLGGRTWDERGPTIRRDILAVDVGLDGLAAVAASRGVDPNGGGDVFFTRGGPLLAPSSSGGFLAPAIPVAVSALGEDDVWVLANTGSRAGVAHWDGRWGVTWALSTGGVNARQPKAIWAPATDDVWATAEGAMWHYLGERWAEVPVDATYRSIHGSGPDDVWFAGDGLAHWDGTSLRRIAGVDGAFDGVWASAPGRVWVWGGGGALLFDGTTTTPVERALGAAAEWDVRGVAESDDGDVFVLTKKAVGTELLWFDPTREKLIAIVSSDLELTSIRGRGARLAAVGRGGAFLHFVPAPIR